MPRAVRRSRGSSLRHSLGEGAAGAGNHADSLLHLAAEAGDLPQVGPKNLDPDRGADAGREHVDAALNRHRPARAEPDQLPLRARRPSRRSAGRESSPDATARALRLITVSTISRGAGSVAVSARPALAKTLSTSGNVMRMRSWSSIASRIVSIDDPGNVTGMYSRVPSHKGGMNSSRGCGRSVRSSRWPRRPGEP